METKGQSFMEMVCIHEHLEAVFDQHQANLVLRRGREARRLFAAYRQLLALHIYHEDEVLLPVFRRIGEIKRWPAELFSGEHRKLEGFLNRSEAALAELGDDLSEDKALGIVRTLDIEGGLKRLLEHHDERERQCLFPVLDEVTEAGERRELLEKISKEWFQLKDSLLPANAG